MGIDMEKWPIGVSRGGLGGWQRRWSPHSENETIFVIWQAIFRRNVFDFSSPRLFIFRHNATELSASKKGRHKKHKRNKMSAALRWPQHKKKKSISKSDDVSLYGQQRRRMCVPKSVAISHVSLPPGSQNIFPQIFKKPANLLGTGNCDGVEYLIELPHWNILSALPNPAAAHNSNLALGYHLIKSKSVYEPYFSRPSSLFFFL